MADFRYQGRNAQGQKVAGIVSAGTRDGAVDKLQQQQIIVLTLDEHQAVTDNGAETRPWWRRYRISDEELILLTRQLYSLSKAGVPIIRALTGLSESASNPAVRDTLNGITASLVAGNDMVTAFRQYPDIFSPIYISMIQIGENTGQVEEALQHLIAHLEMERETRKRIKSALRYPAMVIISISVALAIITLFVIPSFSGVFNKLGAELPLATRILIGISDFVQNYWLPSVLLLGFAFMLFRWWIKQPDGMLWWDARKLRIPLLGSIFERIALGRFSRAFAMLFSAGVPILQCLAIVAEGVGNEYVRQAVLSMQQGVERGERLTSTASGTGLFTPLVLQMMAVGEETGSIDRLLGEVADFYEQEIDYELKQLAEAIEPILLVFLGGMVLVLALGVFLPVWELGAASGLGR